MLRKTTIIICTIAALICVRGIALGNLDLTVSQMACLTNLSGIGKAMLIYANDYEDELPKVSADQNTGDSHQDGRINILTAQSYSPDLPLDGATTSTKAWLVPPWNDESSYWRWLTGVRTITLGRRVELDLRTEGKGQAGAGTVVLTFLGFTGVTELSIACWDLVPGEEHLVCTYDADLKRMQDIGEFIATDRGTGHVCVNVNGDVTGLDVTVVPTASSDALTTFARKCYSLSFLALVSETDEQENQARIYQPFQARS